MRIYQAVTATALALTLGAGVWAADTGKKVAPKAFGIIYADYDGQLRDLENHRPNLIRQPEIRGFSREYLEIPEPSAKARFPQGSPLSWSVRFRVQPPDAFILSVQQLDLQGFELHPLKVESNHRMLILNEANPYRETQRSGLPLKVTPIGGDVLKIEPGRDLPPGEYALVYQPREVGAQAFCFAIDAKDAKDAKEKP